MHIDWASLVRVAVVAAAAAVSVVLLLSFALVGQSTRSGRRVDGSDGTQLGGGAAVVVLCLLAAGLIVGYGLYLIIA
jgi:hypothetical protein